MQMLVLNPKDCTYKLMEDNELAEYIDSQKLCMGNRADVAPFLQILKVNSDKIINLYQNRNKEI